MIYVIGCGGVGSWLTASLCRLADPEQVMAIDGDTLEEKNLDRQLFTSADIGRNKAQALSMRYGCGYFAEFYNLGVLSHDPADWLIGVVDNNPARASILAAADRYQCPAIFAANETTSAEAYLYLPGWKDTQLDPRVMYPEIGTDKANDPQAEAIGCTGAAQRENRQLVSANFMAAALAQHLFVLWGMKVPQMKLPGIETLPHKLVSNLSRLESFEIGEVI